MRYNYQLAFISAEKNRGCLVKNCFSKAAKMFSFIALLTWSVAFAQPRDFLRSNDGGSSPEVRRAEPAQATGQEAPKADGQNGTTVIRQNSAKEPPAVALLNSMETLNDKRRLAIGDRLSLTIVEDEAPPYPVTVTDSGEIEIPYLRRIPVSNMTCKELAFHLKKLLEKTHYYKATVLISLDSAGRTAMSRGRVTLMGQVRAPGQQDIPIDESLTVSKAILRAGGFSNYANKRKVRVVRGSETPGKAQTVIVDMVEVIEKGRRDLDVELTPDDIVSVPEKLINF